MFLFFTINHVNVYLGLKLSYYIQLTPDYPQNRVAQEPQMIVSADNPHNGQKLTQPNT